MKYKGIKTPSISCDSFEIPKLNAGINHNEAVVIKPAIKIRALPLEELANATYEQPGVLTIYKS